MAIKIKFDSNHDALTPTFVLAHRNGDRIATIPAININFSDKFNSYDELSFVVYKYIDGKKTDIWDDLVDFKLVWCKEWDAWFEITVDIEESENTIKKVTARSLGEAELSQVNVYDLSINTDEEKQNDDYVESKFFNADDEKHSILHRILAFAPHYEIGHVDETLSDIVYSNSYDGVSVYDALLDIAESNRFMIDVSVQLVDGNLKRTVNIYDLSTCGEDTTIFITTDNLADSIEYSTDDASVKNCFYVRAQDEKINEAIATINPNGTRYIWNISDESRADMSDALNGVIDAYNALYQEYMTAHTLNLTRAKTNAYNAIIDAYTAYNETLTRISPIQANYLDLVNAEYKANDFKAFLTSECKPIFNDTITNARIASAVLTSANLSPFYVTEISQSTTTSGVSSEILALAKTLIDTRYEIEVNSATLDEYTDIWTGSFKVTNKENSADTITTSPITIQVLENEVKPILYKVYAILADYSTIGDDIVALFKANDFSNRLSAYNLERLNTLADACQYVLDALLKEGAGDENESPQIDTSSDLYNQVYLPYYNKLTALNTEIATRNSQISTINDLIANMDAIRAEVQNELNFDKYLQDADVWNEFVSYRREDVYADSTYSSDNMTSAEIFEAAQKILEDASTQVKNSSSIQHSIQSSIRNLLMLKEFEPLIDYFSVGNWMRLKVDGNVYKLRLLEYVIDFNDFEKTTVTFSDVMKVSDGLTDVQSILAQASSMASSYSATQKQALAGTKSKSLLDNWAEKGLDLTNLKIVDTANRQDISWDAHGILLREFNADTNEYDNQQMKLINRGIYITDNNWRSLKTAIGKFLYRDPVSGEYNTAYGVNAETLVGKMILGEQLGIYNSSNSLTFDKNGLKVSNLVNSVIINPNVSSLFQVLKGETPVITLNSSGDAVITGTINANGGYFGSVNPFMVTDNGLDGTASSNVSTDDIEQADTFDLYSNGSYSNSFTVEIEKSGETDNINNIDLTLTSVSLLIPYSYTITRTITDTTIDDQSTDISGGDGEDDDDTIIDTSSETTTTTTVTETYTDVASVSVSSTETNVTSYVSVSFLNGTKTYRYTYSFGQSDMLTYLKTLARNSNPDLDSSYSLSNITINGASAIANYKYHFTSYNSYAHIGTDYFNYNDILTVRNGKVTLGITTINDLTVTKNINLGENTYIKGKMASNDYWRLFGGGSSNAGYLELATADDGTEPIYVRQYTGQFATLKRTLTLLDGSGNTILPGTLKCRYFNSTATYIDMNSQVVFKGADTWLGYSSAKNERRLRFSSAGSNGTYKHDTYLYGGNASSTTAIGFYDAKNKHSVLVYTDTTNTLTVGASNFHFKDYSGSTRRPVASATTDKKRVSYIGSKSSGLGIGGQWGNSAFSTRSISVSSSDIRIKKNVNDTEVKSAVDVLNKIKMHSFDWTDGNGHQKIGFIADELEKLDERLSIGGGYNEDGTMNVKSVNDFYLLGYVVKAIQEQQKVIDEQRKEIEKLKMGVSA